MSEIPKSYLDAIRNCPPEDRPRGLLPDADAIDEMVQKGTKAIEEGREMVKKATKVIEEVQEIVDDLRARGGIEVSVTPQGPTQVNVPTVKINVPLRSKGVTS